ncbi:hypothetical protein Acsp01_86280 [Actinoplanes sp. NBRC 101535]|nr:hypothetical protein Acsp01_86280 [Actinoplanes sp. NBRC 101535]
MAGELLVWRPAPLPVPRQWFTRRWRRRVRQRWYADPPVFVMVAGRCVRCGLPFTSRVSQRAAAGQDHLFCSTTCKSRIKKRRKKANQRERFLETLVEDASPLVRVVALTALTVYQEMGGEAVSALRMCIGKHRNTLDQAKKAALDLNHKHLGAGTPVATVYRCPICGTYHVGRGERLDVERYQNAGPWFAALLGEAGRLDEMVALLETAPRVGRAELTDLLTEATTYW